MHEFKHGELERRGGRKVRNPRQAIAIALSEAGASNRQSPEENQRRRARTRRKERRGETAQQRKEGKTSFARVGTKVRSRSTGKKDGHAASRGKTTARRKTTAHGPKTAARPSRPVRREPTRAELYREATKRHIVGRSRMTRDELQRALFR